MQYKDTIPPQFHISYPAVSPAAANWGAGTGKQKGTLPFFPSFLNSPPFLTSTLQPYLPFPWNFLPSLALHPFPVEPGPCKSSRGLGSSSSRVWGGAPAENEFGSFSRKMSQLVAIILMILLSQINKFRAVFFIQLDVLGSGLAVDIDWRYTAKYM